MIYSPASSLADRSRVWVMRSQHEGIDAICDVLFGPSIGSSAVELSLIHISEPTRH